MQPSQGETWQLQLFLQVAYEIAEHEFAIYASDGDSVELIVSWAMRKKPAVAVQYWTQAAEETTKA